MEDKVLIYTLYATLNDMEREMMEYKFIRIHQSFLVNLKQRCTRGYKRYKETSGLIEWKECQIFHSIFT